MGLLYRVARRLAGSADDAEELVQQTLIRAFQAWSRFDGRKLVAWLLRIMRNEHYAKFRSAPPPAQLPETEAEEPADETLWDTLCTREQSKKILEELQALPVEYRMAVHLCDVEELSYEEAAEVMEVPIGTVRSRLSRGRCMIREQLDGYMNPSERDEL
jgi:RNA polymerase sigma-70 factor, ECF subfamily